KSTLIGSGLTPIAVQSAVLYSIAVAMLPGLLIIFAPNPGFRLCVAAPGATFCRPASGAQSLPQRSRREPQIRNS
ncbi:MAG: hypothetical protein IKV82_01180, partial [Akkermansia sp.]|nr:hypothetical protein [Akkermansia sp.]